MTIFEDEVHHLPLVLQRRRLH